jgi:hypothetical protein
MIVRLASQFRQSVAAIRNLRITGQGANGTVRRCRRRSPCAPSS